MGTAERSAKTERPEAARAPSGPRAHLDYIDGLRGLAILSVLLYHFWQEARCPLAYWWNPLASGYDGVNLFLVVSGFCLYWPLVRPGRAGREPSLAEFARRRAHRLLPPYYAAVAIFTLAALGARALGLPWSEAPEGGPAATLTAAVWHFALVHNLRPQQIWTLDGPLWTVALEASLYVALPILVVVARKTRIEWAVALAAVVTLTYRVAVDRFAAGAGGWETIGANYTFVLADFLPGRWLEFALGMWAAALVGGGALSGRAPFGLLALACFIPNLWLRERFGQHNPVSEPLFGLCFFFLILSAARAPAGAWGLAGRALRVRPLVRLGGISYSVYLVHYPVLKVLVALSPRLTRDRDVIALCLFVFLPVILGVSYGFFLLVERRFLNGGKRA